MQRFDAGAQWLDTLPDLYHQAVQRWSLQPGEPFE